MTDAPDDPNVVPIKRGRGGRTSGTRTGNGAGWGGERKGASTSRFQKGYVRDVARDRLKAEENARIAEELKAKIYNLAHNAERQETQLQASMALLDRIEGKAVARNVNVNMGDDPNKLTDAELARIARGGLDEDGPADGDSVN